jgi:hypothetical protein
VLIRAIGGEQLRDHFGIDYQQFRALHDCRLEQPHKRLSPPRDVPGS